ncbi:radical SAM family heme chaperone HemW [bacterium]|nr:radical SAM family heme chaperone HemW [bacterium]
MPFCKSKCAYCSFVSGMYPTEIIEKYLKLIPHEITEFVNSINEQVEIPTLYIGGGTPSAVPHESLEEMLLTIIEALPSKPIEISIEVNPSDVSPTLIDTLKRTGINRVSIGAQSFNNSVLKFLSRRHNRDDITKAYDMFRDAGFNNISLDIMHGIPGFGIKRFLDDLKVIVTLNPEHVSLYALSVDEGTKFYDMGLSDKLDPDTTADEYHSAVNVLRNAGYNRYEISNFAKPGCECKHNLNYWKLGEYAGFGPAAGSYIDNEYIERISDIEKYISCLAKKKSTISFIEKYDDENRMKNALIMGMRLEKGVNISDFKKRFGVNPSDIVMKHWSEYINKSYIILDDDSLRFSDSGFYISNSFLSMLM